MIRFVPLKDHSGTCEEELLDWIEAGSREAIWEAFAKIPVRDDASIKAIGFFFLLLLGFQSLLKNQSLLKMSTLASILLSPHTRKIKIRYLFVKPVTCDQG